MLVLLPWYIANKKNGQTHLFERSNLGADWESSTLPNLAPLQKKYPNPPATSTPVHQILVPLHLFLGAPQEVLHQNLELMELEKITHLPLVTHIPLQTKKKKKSTHFFLVLLLSAPI